MSKYRMALLILMSLAFIGLVPNSDADNTKSEKKFFGNLDLGHEGAFWKINEFDEERKRIVKYETEGLSVYRVVANLGYGGYPFFTFTYERPDTQSSSQVAMLETNMTQESGLEKFTAGIQLDPIVYAIFPGDDLSQTILKKLFALRFKYTKELYFGEAKSLLDAVYIPMDAVIDYQNKTMTGLKSIAAEERLAFQTQFIDYTISLPLFSYGPPSDPEKFDFKVGYYDCSWKRPSDSRILRVNNLPTIYDAHYRSKGLELATATRDIGLPGINIDFHFRIGLDDSLRSAVDWEQYSGQEATAKLLEGGLNVWYNKYFSRSRTRGLFLTIGGGWSMRRMTIDIYEPGTTTKTLINDTDELYKLYVQLAYRF